MKKISIYLLALLVIFCGGTAASAENSEEFIQQKIEEMPVFPDDEPVIGIDNNLITSFSITQQQSIVNLALSFRGVPYVYGGNTPSGFDCSGLVQYVYKNAVGISLPRVTTQQENMGSEVSLNSLQIGDILFWGSKGNSYHNAIYIGNNQFVHAPTTGDVVKVTNMAYYYPSFARRIVNGNPVEATQKAVVISPFNEGEALGKLAEFRQKAPNYQAFLRRLPNETQYELVIQPFNVKEVDSKLAELNSKFPNWSKKVNDLRNVSQRKGVLITPFNGMEVAERYLEIKEKTGYSMQITGESSGQVNQTKKAVVISPFNEKEALERLKEFRAAFPSYQSFLMQLPNKTHYQLVVQPFTPAEANLKLNEMKAKFPNWSMKVDNLQDVINRKNILIAPFNGMEAWERYLEIKVKTGYSMHLVDI